jgi:hypothetical protein
MVSIKDDHIRAMFRSDGSVSRFYFPPWDGGEGDKAHAYAAWLCGYGEDRRTMSVHHELTHHFAAQRLGWPCSFVVWHDAHGWPFPPEDQQWRDIFDYEEHVVVSWQRYANCGELDIYGQLEEAFGSKLNRYTSELVELWRRSAVGCLGSEL